MFVAAAALVVSLLAGVGRTSPPPARSQARGPARGAAHGPARGAAPGPSPRRRGRICHRRRSPVRFRLEPARARIGDRLTLTIDVDAPADIESVQPRLEERLGEFDVLSIDSTPTTKTDEASGARRGG